MILMNRQFNNLIQRKNRTLFKDRYSCRLILFSKIHLYLLFLYNKLLENRNNLAIYFYKNIYLSFKLFIALQMSSILAIHIGNSGAKIGSQFWNILSNQHNINSKTKGNAMTCFYEAKDHYQANSIFIGLDNQTKKEILQQDKQNLHSDKKIVTNSAFNYGCFTQGFSTQGYNMIKQGQEMIRKSIQLMDTRPTLLITSGIGGGSDSGYFSRMLSILIQFDRSLVNHTNLILPDIELCSSIELYNSIYALHHDIQYSYLTTVFENKVASKVIKSRQNSNYVTFQNINHIYGEAICQITSPFRFKSSLSSSYRKLMTNLVIYPRRHYVAQSLSNNGLKSIKSCLSNKNFLGMQNVNNTQFYAMNITSRNPFMYEEEIWKQYHSVFIKPVDWFPQNLLHISLCDQLNMKQEPSATALVNSISITTFLAKLQQNFKQCLEKRTFLHHFLQICDQLQLRQALSNVDDLILEYNDYQNNQLGQIE